MLNRRLCTCFASALVCLGMAGADAPDAMRLRVVALGDKGVVGDLALADWTVRVDGAQAKVLSQRAPAETEKEGQKWAFVLLPIRGPEYREMALRSIATFMTTLPPSDSVLVVLRTAKGLECLTPGFSVRPSVWAKALDVAREELGPRLPGNAGGAFVVPAAQGPEKAEDSMEPVKGFLARLMAKKLDKRSDDATNLRTSVTDSYNFNDLSGHTIAIGHVLKSMEAFGAFIAKESGVKHTVIFSRNEIDDLVNPAWARKNARVNGKTPLNRPLAPDADPVEGPRGQLQCETMVRDVTLLHENFKEQMVTLGVEVHSVGVGSAGYNGAFADIASATGGRLYPFNNDLTTRLCSILPLWASSYELQVAVPAKLPHPAKVAVQSPRKEVTLFAPALH